MLVPSDLRFQVAALFVFLFLPACFFVFRRKWRIAEARRDEIDRLLLLASEEAFRAEFEDSIGFSIPTVVQSEPHCAVCYSLTHNRCARCKSVHYCSGKCQIIHWRQGHKDECRPPLLSFENNEEAINFVENSVKQPYPVNYIANIENASIQYAKQSDAAWEKPGSFSELSVNNDLVAVNDSTRARESGSLSEVESFSGDGICIDSSSDNESLHDFNSHSCDSISTLDNLESSSRDTNVELGNSLGEESYTKVEAGCNVSASRGPTEVAANKIGATSDLTISPYKFSTEPTVSTSDFWNGSLDCSKTKKYVHNNNANTKSGRSGDSVFYDSKPSLRYFNLSGTEVPSDIYPVTSKAHKLIERTSPDKESPSITRQMSSTIFSLEKQPDVRVPNAKQDGNSTKSREFSFPLSGLNVTNNLVIDKKDTSLSLGSKKDEFSPKTPSDISPSGSKGSTPTIKSVKVSRESTMGSQGMTSSLKTSMLKVAEELKAPKPSIQSEDVGRNYEKGVFPYELFVKLYHWNKVEMRPCGLINCGNSCYANAVLQCLAFTPPLTSYLLQGLHSRSCAMKEWCFTCEFERLILKAKEGSSPLSPIGILSQIKKIGSHLSTGREEDAHEFLRYAIDSMQSTCLREAGASASDPLEEETTLMGLTFGGYLRSKIKCTRCHGKSERHERMMDLTVEIEGNIETLEDALRQFTATECLDGENKYHCSRCKSYVKAKKKLSILEAPNVLTIALKRFQSGKFGKLNKSIRFPEILNMAPYMRGGSDKSPIYRLYGVVVHLDVMNAAFSGHYVCYVRNAHNKWYMIDDSMVKAVELERVLNKGAYMLFYSRCSPRAPRSIRSSVASRDLSPKIKNPVVVNPSQNIESNTSSRHNHRAETRVPLKVSEFDTSSSDSSSMFSNSDEVSSSTDSNRDSVSADDISDYIFGYSNGFWRHSSDSETSSSSSSPPLFTKHSALHNSERYVSSEEVHEIGVPFLQTNTSKQVRNLVNSSSSSSSCRGSDSERLGWTNSSYDTKSGVHLRQSLRKKTDQAFHHTVLS